MGWVEGNLYFFWRDIGLLWFEPDLLLSRNHFLFQSTLSAGYRLGRLGTLFRKSLRYTFRLSIDGDSDGGDQL
jgi:hypothetical protein